MIDRLTITIATMAFLLLGGCLVENEAYSPDGGVDTGGDGDSDSDTDADSDTDSDTDTESDTDADSDTDSDTDTESDTGSDTDTCDDENVLACNEDHDVAMVDACGTTISVVDNCDDDHGICIEETEGEPACACENHFDIETSCNDCLIGFGGLDCAVCQVGHQGPDCADCTSGFEVNGDGQCDSTYSCDLDHAWLLGGSMPPAQRDAEEFTTGGTSSEPTVQDITTNLEWALCPVGQTWNLYSGECEGTAETHSPSDGVILSWCSLHSWGGHSDWRLPSLSEFISISDFGAWGQQTYLVFDNTGTPQKVTSTQQEGPGSPSVIFNEDYGTTSAADETAFEFRCVRSDVVVEPVPTRFSVGQGDGSTVVDVWTDLEWRRCPLGTEWNGAVCQGTVSTSVWTEAQNACSVSMNGHDDWTLPSLPQLSSLKLNGEGPRRLPTEAFPDISDDETLWTSSYTLVWDDAFPRVCSFQDDTCSTAPEEELHSIMCVRQTEL